jgi:virulence factor Mce-like protein
MRRPPGSTAALGRRPALVGSSVLAVLLLLLYVSYNAQNGLPLQSTYHVSVDVPNASEMTKNSDVRIGGARVGQVLSINAEPAGHGRPPFARLGVVLTGGPTGGLPVDTRTKIRLASLLGGKYLELTPGSSRQTIPDGGHVGLANSIPIVDLDQAFRAFGGPTAASLRRVIAQLGDALAGRGTAINNTLTTTRLLLPPLQRVLRTLVDPRTGLARLVTATASAAGALAPLADTINAAIDHATTTLVALDAAGGSLDQTIEALAPTEGAATTVLHHLRPVLADAASLTISLRPAAALLPRAAQALDVTITTATPVLRRVPRLAVSLRATFEAVDRLADDPASTASIRALGTTDLATFSTSLFLGLGGVLQSSASAQLHCNAIALWARNVSSALSDGDPAGSWLTYQPIVSASHGQQSASPAADLHFNPYPREDAAACEAGNERYAPGQAIGHPAGTYGTAVDTSPSGAGARARAGSRAASGSRR